MTLEEVGMRRGALAGLAAVSLMILAAPGPLVAQQYGAPTRYGEPYAAPPAHLGNKRALDGTPRRTTSRPAPYAEPYQPPPPRPSIWQGLYVGGHGGYSTGWATPSGSYDTVDISGGALGGHVGYNVQQGNWVIGLEADGTWNDTSGSRAFAGPTFVDARADWTSSLRARIGYAFGHVLVYATGGAALGGFDIGVSSLGVGSRATETVFGYAVGGGLEMKLSDSWSGRIEALHYGFDDKTFNFATGNVPVDLGVTTVRAGLTYHFR